MNSTLIALWAGQIEQATKTLAQEAIQDIDTASKGRIQQLLCSITSSANAIATLLDKDKS